MRHFIVYIGLFVFLLIGCKNEPEGIQSIIAGKFPELAEKQLILEELEIRNTRPIDSVTIEKDGSFRFEFPIDDAGFYVLKTSDDNLLLLQLEKGENVNLNCKNALFNKGYEVEGSPGSKLLMDYEFFMAKQHRQIDSLAEVYYNARGKDNFLERKAALDSSYNNIVSKQRDYIYDFGKKHPASLTSLIVINRRLGQNQVLDEEADFKLFHSIDSALMANYPSNKHALDHHDRVKEIQGRIFDRRVAEDKVLPGKKAPDIVLNDTTGNPVSLKSFAGHPVLIQFWAGWNAVARQDNQQLVKLYPSFQKSGVKILGVSFDDNGVIWKGAIKLDELPWPQVSDLQGMRSEIAKTYNLPEELPYYYLLDNDLTIVYKNSSIDSVLIQLEQLTLPTQ
ncbi:MAG TPA: redoxin domain-containing protein [Bacteroidales bacterium]|nr:redoxin domain-containing protein [Bacteroidales bacterium]HRX96936.1 redoxin domain-containing protein [Bacteroidales bacterium]